MLIRRTHSDADAEIIALAVAYAIHQLDSEADDHAQTAALRQRPTDN